MGISILINKFYFCVKIKTSVKMKKQSSITFKTKEEVWKNFDVSVVIPFDKKMAEFRRVIMRSMFKIFSLIVFFCLYQ